ncbi:MAG: hypothetical protein VKP57_06810 [Candidatus Sericytochromatia bacterium]|nr:hypothetical protein [Candidatus Sericytochromatia bacterium]
MAPDAFVNRSPGSRPGGTGPLRPPARGTGPLGEAPAPEGELPAVAPAMPRPIGATTAELSAAATFANDLKRLGRALEGLEGGIQALDEATTLGLLKPTSSDARNLLNQLLKLAGTPKTVAGVPGAVLAADVLRDLAHPESIHQGRGTFTCTAATAQGILAARDPGEYARLVADLAVDGKAVTKAGDTLSADLRGFAVDEGRSGTSDLLQEAFMNFGRAGAAEGAPSTIAGFAKAAVNAFTGGVFGSNSRTAPPRSSQSAPATQIPSPKPPPTRRLGAETAGTEADGLTPAQFSHLMTSLTGEASVPLEVDATTNRQALLRLILESLDRDGPIPVGVVGTDRATGQPTFHAIQITAFDGQTVFFQDPGEAGTVGKGSMPLANFLASLKMINVPYETLDRVMKDGLSDIGKIANVAPRSSQKPREALMAGKAAFSLSVEP